MPIHSTPVGPDQHQDGTAPPSGDPVQGPGAPGKAAPLLDPRVLGDMERDFVDTAVVTRFAHDFRASLDGKIDRLQTRIRDGDAIGAADAVLSVTTSAAMVGARRLGQAALVIQRLVASHDLEGAERSLTLLRACGAETSRELEALYPADD